MDGAGCQRRHLLGARSSAYATSDDWSLNRKD